MYRSIVFSIAVILLISSCGYPTDPNSPGTMPELPTPTPTPAARMLAAETAEVTKDPGKPAAGEIELRFLDPETQKTCMANFPVTFDWNATPPRMNGSGTIDCKFETQQCGEACVTYHSEYAMPDGVIDGIFHPATDSYPSGTFEATLAGKYSFTQYWTDIPQGAFMAYTEANPAVITEDALLTLFFDFKDGATCDITPADPAYAWHFTLHLR